jgi:UDP-N-acetylmuramyl-tripeptide synthetase
VFVAIRGQKVDAANYIAEAISRGARVIIRQARRESFALDNDTVFINVKDTRMKLSDIASRFYRNPSRKIKVIGVTGTNGKTTTTYLIDKILSHAGFNTGLIGTVNYKYRKNIIPAINTTPGSLELQSLLSRMVKSKIDYCVMEVSSHALDQDRVADVDFSAAIFTNLTQDHLDYHLSLERYFLAKKKLFKNLSSRAWAIVNKDDSYAPRLLRCTQADKITYGIKNRADVIAKNIRLGLGYSSFCAVTPCGKVDITTAMVGYHNIYNLLAAVSLCVIEGIDLDLIREAIPRLRVVRGRLEPVECGQPFKVFVDYAHTEDALKNVLSALRQLAHNRIIVVFGCGGDRDKDKRPKMGRVASRFADLVILTSDNPRTEDPKDIIRDIEKGMTAGRYRVILDRAKAINTALSLAEEGDIVLIAGKGHETAQVFKDKRVPFDDRAVARKMLRCLKSGIS